MCPSNRAHIESSSTAFDLLAASQATQSLGSFKVRESRVACAGGAVLWAVDVEGAHHLLIPVDGDFAPDRRSAGVQIVPIRLISPSGEALFADVVCRRAHLAALFGIVADEILDQITMEPDHPLHAAAQTLDRWRELLERPRVTLLGTQQLAGLLGELLTLDEVWSASGRTSPAVWRGPLGATHDISDGVNAVEVKATMIREGFMVEIHGLDQLQPPSNGRLLLRAFRFEQAERNGITVPDAVDRLIDRTDDRPTLLTLLSAAGYSIDDSEAYRLIRFITRDERTYDVDLHFPAITERVFRDGLPPSVSRIRYAIDISGALPALMPAKAASAHFASIGA